MALLQVPQASVPRVDEDVPAIFRQPTVEEDRGHDGVFPWKSLKTLGMSCCMLFDVFGNHFGILDGFWMVFFMDYHGWFFWVHDSTDRTRVSISAELSNNQVQEVLEQEGLPVQVLALWEGLVERPKLGDKW